MMPRFLPGIDTLVRDHRDWFVNRRVALLTHQAAVNTAGVSSAELLWCDRETQLVLLMTPEHGFYGAAGAGDPVRSHRHPVYGLPVYSLYGTARRPHERLLRRIDALIVDLQDLGARPYTYVSTLRYALEACADAGTPVIVADRPVPLPRIVDGPGLTPGYESFVACIRAPMCYGMTPGEAALWLKTNLRLDLDLRIAPMRGYARDPRRGPDWPPWVPPSPGIRSWESAACYLSTVFTEALPSLSCGRTTTLPFQLLGSPWMDGPAVADELNAARLPGVRFHPHPFVNPSGVFAGRLLSGIRMVVHDPNTFHPLRVAVHALAVLTAMHGCRRVWSAAGSRPDFFDKLFGSSAVRESLLAGESATHIVDSWCPDIGAFTRSRRACLLYKPG